MPRQSLLRTYSLENLIRDTYFRQSVCQISAACGGSGGGISSINGQSGPIVTLTASDIETENGDTIQEALDNAGGGNLQSVTDSGNITSNALQVTGADNLDPELNGAKLLVSGDQLVLYNVLDGIAGSFSFGTNDFAIVTSGSLSFEGSNVASTTFSFRKDGFTLGNVQGGDAVNPNDFTTLQQVEETFNSQSLQSVTSGTENNITSNTLQITGADNVDVSTPSALIFKLGDNSFFSTATSQGGYGMAINDASGIVTVSGGNGGFVQLGGTDGGDPATPIALFSTCVVGNPAESNNQFVTLGQVSTIVDERITPNEVVSAAQPPTANLVPGTYYTYTGEDDTAWALPEVTGNTGTRIGIINASTEVLTLNSFAGGNDILENGNNVNTITVAASEKNILYNNSISWVVII